MEGISPEPVNLVEIYNAYDAGKQNKVWHHTGT
jgi:hypothetical protein